MVSEERCSVHAGDLRALIRVDQHLVLRFASPHGHKQSLQYDIGGLAALHCPADDPAGIEVDDDRKVSEALAGSDVCDVRDPGLVRSRYVTRSETRRNGLFEKQGTLTKTPARNFDAISQAFGDVIALALFSIMECRNFFKAAGYGAQ